MPEPKTLEEKLAAVRAKHEREIAAAEMQESIRQAIEDAGLPEPRRIYCPENGRALYDVGPSIEYGIRFSSCYNTPHLTPEELRTIGEGLGPLAVPLCKWQQGPGHGPLSIVPRSFWDALDDDEPKTGSAEHVAPVYYVDEPAFGRTLTMVVALPGVAQLVKVQAHVAPLVGDVIGHHNARRIEFRGGFRYERAGYVLNHKRGAERIEDAEGEGLAGFGVPISWWSPEDSPGRYSVTWEEWTEEGCPAVRILDTIAGAAISSRVHSLASYTPEAVAVDLLRAVSIETEGEPVEVLREALAANILDGTIDEETAKAAGEAARRG